MRNALLAALLTASLAAGVAPGPDLREHLAAQQTLRNECEEGLRQVLGTCGPDSAKWLECRTLYRTAQERTNSVLATLVLDVRARDLGHDRSAQMQEAEASALQLRSYLDLAQCDGTTAQAKGAFLAPLLLKLPSLVSAVKAYLQLQDLAKSRMEARRREVISELEGMQWRPEEAFIGRLAPAPPPAVRTDAQARSDPAPPRYLRLDGGFHTAPIRQMALSADEQILATAAEDKTVRIWSARTLEGQRVLRPPLGPGDSGRLYAVALSPDGTTAVTAGFTRAPEGGSHRLYLLDVRDGHLIREIPGLPQVVNRLSIAPDGATVVAHLGGSSGLRWYRLADGVEVARDPNYQGPSFAGAYARDGRYAASSEDGFIRLYGPDRKLIVKAKAPGPSPFGLAFRPDGTTLALGHGDGCQVDLLSADTLAPIGRVDTAGAEGPLGIVAWSADGGRLFACGGQDFGPRLNPVYCWPEAGRGVRSEVRAARATLCDLLPLKDGGILLAAQDPRLSRLDAQLQVVATRSALPGPLDQAREGLRVDASGSVVDLGWRFPGKGESSFSLQPLGLGTVRAGLAPPLIASRGLEVEGWRDGQRPALNGTALPGLEPHEVVRSLSLARNGQGFALGTDWCLRLYDVRGRMERRIDLPAACWGLNHTPDGRFLVAALADGSVRWFTPGDGGERMALFVHPDGQRWALWTPEGYYAASVGGEDLLGWHVQRPGQAGDFFPLGQFRTPFCQPELFPALLKAADLGQALGALGLPVPASAAAPAPSSLALPPVLRILEPAEGSLVPAGSLAFSVLVRNYGPQEPVKAWHIYLDGEKLAPVAGLPPSLEAQAAGVSEARYTVPVPVPDRPCRVALALETRSGLSEPVEVRLRPKPGPGLAVNPASRLAGAPALNLVAIGIADYQSAGLKLTYPAKDAQDVAAIFQGMRSKLYSEVRVSTLLDRQATRSGILDTLRGVRDRATPRDVSVIFLSGHGLTSESSSSYYFLPADADPLVASTLVDGRDLRDLLGQTQGKVVLLLDTCHSGNVLGEGRMRGLDDAIKLARFINELTSASNGVVVLSSSTGRQLSLESEAWGNGAFTKALREGLGGRADPDHSGRVTLSMLETYLRTRVTELTHGAQTPVVGKPSVDLEFPLVLSD